MAITSLNKIFKTNEKEFGFVTTKFKPGSVDTVNVYIPKILGTITTTGTYSIHPKNIFDNDDDCKIEIPSSIKLYKTIDVKFNSASCDWNRCKDSDGYVKVGTRVLIEFIGGNLQNPFISMVY